jgi:hypothetical protein
MNNWRTTLTGFVTLAASTAAHYNLVIPDYAQTAIVLVGLAVLAMLTKDASNTEEN